MKKIALTLCAAALAFSLISCGSKPEPEPEIEPQAPVVEEIVEEPEVEPEIESEPQTEPEETAEEPVVVDNTEALESLKTSREEALNSGAEIYADEELAGVDSLYAELKEKSENGEDISEESESLKLAYQTVAVYAKAMELKSKIDEEDLARFAQNVYDEGVKLIDEIDDSEEWNEEVFAKAQEAYKKFNTVCIQGYKALARQARENAFKAKRDADGVKAGVARKEKYNDAVASFKLGDSLYAMQSSEKSIEKYEAAEAVFTELYEELFEARAAAQRAIDEAKRKVEESARIAEQADEESPLSENDDSEFLEDEDTVLLEDDDYENPEDAEADIPEELSEEDSGAEITETGSDYETESEEDESESIESEESDENEEEAL